MTKKSTKEKDVIDQILDQLDLHGMSQEELFGKDGLAKKLTARLLNKALEAEMDMHLGYKKHSNDGDGSGNSRNGYSTKKVLTGEQKTEIQVPRDRNGDFEPVIVKKYSRRLPVFNGQIISLYSNGMTTRDIQDHLKEMYDVEVSPELISNVTDAVHEDVRQWRTRPLDDVYPIVVNNSRYGYRRIHSLLHREGVAVSEKVVRRLMKEERLVVVFVKKKRYSSYRGEISPEVPNLLNRDFRSDSPGQKLLTDNITEFSIPAGKVYLSPLVDCYDGMVISWSIGTSPGAELANSMLRNGIALLDDSAKPIVHSDRGCHYRWPEWIGIMNEAGFTRSMSKKGCSPDNSACEGFFGRLKNEMFYGKDWKRVSIENFMAQVDAYIRWYNEKRIKMSLGGLSPLEFRLKNKEDKSIA